MTSRLFRLVLLVLWIWLPSSLPAQTGPSASPEIAAPILPVIKHIEARYTPQDLMKMVQEASPSGWKMIQEKAKSVEEGKTPTFDKTDLEKIPQKEQQALITTFQPIIIDAIKSLTPQEQMQLLMMAQEFKPESMLAPIVNLLHKKEAPSSLLP
jgi:hypothetical protein